MNLNQPVVNQLHNWSLVSIPIRDLMNLNPQLSPSIGSHSPVSIPIRDLMNLNLFCHSIILN